MIKIKKPYDQFISSFKSIPHPAFAKFLEFHDKQY